MAAVAHKADSAGKRLDRARGGAAWVRGKAREVDARGIGEGRRGVAGAGMLRSGAAQARLPLVASSRKEK